MQLFFVNSHKDVKGNMIFALVQWFDMQISLPLSVFELKFISPYFFFQFYVIQPYLEFKTVNLRYKINYFKIIPLYLCFKCLFTLLVRKDSAQGYWDDQTYNFKYWTNEIHSSY